MVPGPDGSKGFGGTCFPKDINALIHFAESQNLEPSVLKAAWDKNLKVRENKDWLTMFGRAVSEDTWMQLLDFINIIDDQFTEFDPNGAWPYLIDEFVAFKQNENEKLQNLD